jgi:hypothetical protein
MFDFSIQCNRQKYVSPVAKPVLLTPYTLLHFIMAICFDISVQFLVSTNLWDMMFCGHVEVYRHFKVMSCLHHHGKKALKQTES